MHSFRAPAVAELRAFACECNRIAVTSCNPGIMAAAPRKPNQPDLANQQVLRLKTNFLCFRHYFAMICLTVYRRMLDSQDLRENTYAQHCTSPNFRKYAGITSSVKIHRNAVNPIRCARGNQWISRSIFREKQEPASSSVGALGCGLFSRFRARLHC